MQKYLIKIFLIGIVLFLIKFANAGCPTNHAIQHTNAGVGNLPGTTCASCFPRFWCLSTGSSNNNGTNVAWWQYYAATSTWWYDGSWQNPGVNGCCGMWDGDAGDSRSMMAVVEYYQNEGTANHFGLYETEVCERQLAGGTDFFFNRPASWNFSEIP